MQVSRDASIPLTNADRQEDLIQSFSTPGVWSSKDLDHILGRYGTFVVERGTMIIFINSIVAEGTVYLF